MGILDLLKQHKDGGAVPTALEGKVVAAMTESAGFKNLEGSALDKAGKLADEKTKGAHTDQIDKLVEKGKESLGTGTPPAGDSQPGQNPPTPPADDQQQ